jgi:hypothetical protein
MIREKEEEVHLSNGVKADAIVHVIDGYETDTYVTINGQFCIFGGEREEFYKELGGLIEKYRI